MSDTTSRGKEIALYIVTAVFFITAIYLSLNLFNDESEKAPAVNLDNDVTVTDRIDLDFHVTAIDPVKGDMTVRVNSDPQGIYSEDSLTLSRDVKIYTNSNVGKNEFEFKQGNRISPFEITVDLRDGSLMDYPFDQHKADLSVQVTSSSKDSAGKVTTIDVPIVKDAYFYSSMAGYKVSAVKEINAGDGYSDMEFSIARTRSVTMFSVFVIALMWLMTIAIILVVGSIVIRKRKVEYSMFAFLSAMLFAMPALRNVQPFVPTIGCYSDYIAFFWAELVVAIGLVLLIGTWLKRPAPKHEGIE